MARDKGTGTVVATKTPKGADRWRVAVTMADGRRVWRTAKTPREAERIRRQLVEARELDLDPTRQTLAAFLRSWIAGLRDARHQRVRPRTLDSYASVVENHVIPTLGSLKLAAVTPRRVQAWIDADQSAPGTVILHAAVLRRALNIAVRQRLLPYNPALHVELPRARDAARPLTLDEIRRLLEATKEDRLHALWRLAIVTGLREGELLGLGWDDLDGPMLTVSGQLQRLDGRWVRTSPKAARRLTRIALDGGTVAVLEAHRRKMAAERTPDWTYHGLMFPTTIGRPFHPTDLRRQFAAALKAAGIAPHRFHDLRHASAHILNDLGVPSDVRKARLGHTTDAMAAHYAGASEAQDRIAADRLGEAISG